MNALVLRIKKIDSDYFSVSVPQRLEPCVTTKFWIYLVLSALRWPLWWLWPLTPLQDQVRFWIYVLVWVIWHMNACLVYYNFQSAYSYVIIFICEKLYYLWHECSEIYLRKSLLEQLFHYSKSQKNFSFTFKMEHECFWLNSIFPWVKKPNCEYILHFGREAQKILKLSTASPWKCWLPFLPLLILKLQIHPPLIKTAPTKVSWFLQPYHLEFQAKVIYSSAPLVTSRTNMIWLSPLLVTSFPSGVSFTFGWHFPFSCVSPQICSKSAK